MIYKTSNILEPFDTNDDIYFSAADLVKRSANQINFLRERREKIISARISAGVKYQHKEVEKLNMQAEEMRSIYKVKNFVIFASHDSITKDGNCVEIKSIEGEWKDWYLESSLLQCAFYLSIIKGSDGTIVTPSFRVKEGYDRVCSIIDKNCRYFLHFGDVADYEIQVRNYKRILEYFTKKAEATLDKQSAIIYDSNHKFKHFKELKRYFTYRKVDLTQANN